MGEISACRHTVEFVLVIPSVQPAGLGAKRNIPGDEVLDAVGEEIKSEYCSVIDFFKGHAFINFVDLRELKVMPDRAKELVSELMAYGMERKLFYSININPSTVSKMSITTAGQMSDTQSKRVIVSTMEEGEEILKQKLAEMNS